MSIFRNFCVRFVRPMAGLEILQCIPVVKILIFLDLAKIISFIDEH